MASLGSVHSNRVVRVSILAGGHPLGQEEGMAEKKDRRERRKKYVAPELKKGENLRRITAVDGTGLKEE